MMSPRLYSIFQALALAGLAWFIYGLLYRVHPLLAVLTVLVAGFNVVVVWMLRYDRDRIAPLFALPYLQHYLHWTCHLAGEQPPSSHAVDVASTEFLLHSAADFRQASWRARQVVFGHDAVVDQFLSRIRDALALRKRRRDRSGEPPLASFLFVGGEGIGKRYLARVMAKLLFRSGPVLAFECDKMSPGTLLGSAGSPGELLEAVRRQPCQLVLLEHIDAAPPALLQELQALLARGVSRDPVSGRNVSFANVIFVLTTTKGAEHLALLAAKLLSERAWHEQASDAIGSDTTLEPRFLHAIGEIVLCQQPTDYVKSQVTAQLMLKECQDHGVELRQADPLIVAAEVLRMDEQSGFGRLPHNIKKLLAKPLLAASQQNKSNLSLHVRVPSGPS